MKAKDERSKRKCIFWLLTIKEWNEKGHHNQRPFQIAKHDLDEMSVLIFVQCLKLRESFAFNQFWIKEQANTFSLSSLSLLDSILEAINLDDMRLSLPREFLIFVICYWCLTS